MSMRKRRTTGFVVARSLLKIVARTMLGLGPKLRPRRLLKVLSPTITTPPRMMQGSNSRKTRRRRSRRRRRKDPLLPRLMDTEDGGAKEALSVIGQDVPVPAAAVGSSMRKHQKRRRKRLRDYLLLIRVTASFCYRSTKIRRC